MSSHEPSSDPSDQLSAITYALYSFSAMLPPVALTMLLSSACTVFINTPENSAAAKESFADSYQVVGSDDDDKRGTAVAKASLNALVICAVMAGMTFVIVACFYFRCMKLITGYMVLSSFLMLSVMGGSLFNVAITKYALSVDVYTFSFLTLNFAVLGVVSTFYDDPAVTPRSFKQFYAIATSVLLSWQLTHFDPLTGWALLVALGERERLPKLGFVFHSASFLHLVFSLLRFLLSFLPLAFFLSPSSSPSSPSLLLLFFVSSSSLLLLSHTLFSLLSRTHLLSLSSLSFQAFTTSAQC